MDALNTDPPPRASERQQLPAHGPPPGWQTIFWYGAISGALAMALAALAAYKLLH